MPSLLNFTPIGHLGRDPEIRYTQQGVAVCDFSMAISNGFINENGEWEETDPTWLKITAWRALAERIKEQGLKKGDLVFVDVAKLDTSTWIDAEDEVHASIELTARRVIRLSQSSGASRSDSSTGRTSSTSESREEAF